MVRSTPDAYSDAFGKRNHGDIDDDGIPVEKHDLLKKAESTLGLHMSKKAHILLTNLDFPAVRRMQLRPGYAAKTDIPSLNMVKPNRRPLGCILHVRGRGCMTGDSRCQQCIGLGHDSTRAFDCCVFDPDLWGGVCANCVYMGKEEECSIPGRIRTIQDEGSLNLTPPIWPVLTFVIDGETTYEIRPPHKDSKSKAKGPPTNSIKKSNKKRKIILDGSSSAQDLSMNSAKYLPGPRTLAEISKEISRAHQTLAALHGEMAALFEARED
ncbi:hypothetical protein MMC28_001890 [Mycoblastus sanguinarius]|nr:hypothetical protein [Mycoblastus sanguinarius]